jgi:hypothetical protein
VLKIAAYLPTIADMLNNLNTHYSTIIQPSLRGKIDIPSSIVIDGQNQVTFSSLGLSTN